MDKKFLKNNPFGKSLVNSFISSKTPAEESTEIRKNVNTDKRKAVNTEKQVKLTVVVPVEIDILIEDIARKRRQETGRKPTKKSLIIEAVRLLAEKEGIIKGGDI